MVCSNTPQPGASVDFVGSHHSPWAHRAKVDENAAGCAAPVAFQPDFANTDCQWPTQACSNTSLHKHEVANGFEDRLLPTCHPSPFLWETQTHQLNSAPEAQVWALLTPAEENNRASRESSRITSERCCCIQVLATTSHCRMWCCVAQTRITRHTSIGHPVALAGWQRHTQHL